MIDRVERQVHLKPKLGDTAYGAAPLLNSIVKEKKIGPHIPGRRSLWRQVIMPGVSTYHAVQN